VSYDVYEYIIGLWLCIGLTYHFQWIEYKD